MSDVRLLPLRVSVCGADGLPAQPTKEDKVPVKDRLGETAVATVTVTVCDFVHPAASVPVTV